MFSPYGYNSSGWGGNIDIGAAPTATPRPRPTPIDAPILNDLLQVAVAAPQPAASASGGSGMRTAGGIWNDLKASFQNRGTGVNKFITSPRGLALGGLAAGTTALMAAAQAAQNQDPNVTGLRSVVPSATAGLTALLPGAIGAIGGGIVGGPLGATIGASALSALFSGAAGEAGAGLGRALTGQSPTDKAVSDYLKQARAQQTIAEEGASLRNALADADAARQMRLAAAQSLLNSQNQMGQALAGALNYQSPVNPYIGTIG